MLCLYAIRVSRDSGTSPPALIILSGAGDRAGEFSGPLRTRVGKLGLEIRARLKADLSLGCWPRCLDLVRFVLRQETNKHVSFRTYI